MSDPEQPPETDEPFDLEREPLDVRPATFDIDWGGDGSDLTRPVRAHVLTALRPATGPYQPPLDALLILGEVDDEELEELCDELDIGQEHVPELLRMLRDRALNTAESDTPAAWAPSHALEILAQLDLSASVPELLPIFDLGFDRFGDQLIEMMGPIGAPAIAPLQAYIGDRSRWVWGRCRATEALREIAQQHPELLAEVVTILSAILAATESTEEEILTSAVTVLMALKAVETLPQIRHAFELGKIDEMMAGSWGMVQQSLGVRPDPNDPLVDESRQRYEAIRSRMFAPEMRERQAARQATSHAAQPSAEQRAAAQKHKQDKARKEKNRRKAASASRKANRKKRK